VRNAARSDTPRRDVLRQVAEDQRAEAVRRRKQVEAEAARKAAPRKKAVRALFEGCAMWWYVLSSQHSASRGRATAFQRVVLLLQPSPR
jgi:hypothetical protein